MQQDEKALFFREIFVNTGFLRTKKNDLLEFKLRKKSNIREKKSNELFKRSLMCYKFLEKVS